MGRENGTMARLAVIPSDPLDAYEKAGIGSWLAEYYNPRHVFDEVYVLSPLEKEERWAYGMRVVPTRQRELRRRIRELRINVVRAYGGYWACDMACNHKVSGVPAIVSVHDRREGWLHDTIRRADAVFCTSETVRELVRSRRPATKNIWVLPNRVHFDVMYPHPAVQCADLSLRYPYRHRILHVGRKVPEKNLDTAIRALRILGDEYCLLAVGRRPADEYIRLAEQERVRERCYFIEAIENSELARYYSWTDCLCNPSRSEGFGIIFIEALACEAVVVTSDIAPMNEYITHMENGLLVKEYEDPHALAAMIRIACTNEELRRRLKANARISVEPFEKGRIDTLEASYYQTVLAMRDQGSFAVPLFKRAACSVTMLARGCVRGSVKRLVGGLKGTRQRQRTESVCKAPAANGGE